MSKQSGRLIQIILTFSEYVNFKFLYFSPQFIANLYEDEQMSRILDFLQELSENLNPI